MRTLATCFRSHHEHNHNHNHNHNHTSIPVSSRDAYTPRFSAIVRETAKSTSLKSDSRHLELALTPPNRPRHKLHSSSSLPRTNGDHGTFPDSSPTETAAGNFPSIAPCVSFATVARSPERFEPVETEVQTASDVQIRCHGRGPALSVGHNGSARPYSRTNCFFQYHTCRLRLQQHRSCFASRRG